ncbi:response regulator transcription factor [Rhizobium sp. P40RR-XXII]|uniref:winged helix-turn-helix transcriptional regulator n=1 Tax=unclassified Rhizobium TaxID=2613769 RepID=UPI00145770D8|nr:MULTISPECIES: response regulator transcription factor [unclassified Rhizobium]NLR85338.1 response regulator transcription factor [Rhizobium sp. P28RR-XV]NLS16685.1 response regulator transcription factor [Rhizobium sp. P40RR-XXII]
MAACNEVIIWTSDAELFLPFSYILKTEGFIPSVACSANDVLASCTERSPCAVLFDCTHETQDAVSICGEIRRATTHDDEVRLIALLRSEAQPLHLSLLQAGVDDFLFRPLSPEKLLTSLMQATGQAMETAHSKMVASLAFADLEVDVDSRRIHCNGHDFALPPIEFNILRHLMNREGQLCSRSELIASAWPASAEVTPRTVDVHIGRLRKALGELPGCGAVIRTVHAAGYVFKLPGLRKSE